MSLWGARDVASCEGRPSFRPPLGVRSEGRAARGGDLASRAPPCFPPLGSLCPLSLLSASCLFTHFVTSDHNNLPLHFFPNFLFLPAL